MGSLEQVLKAELSSDLTQRETFCDVDVLHAVGVSAIYNPRHFAVFRVKYMYDVNSIDEAALQFISWTKRSMINRRQSLHHSRELGWSSLKQWINDQCPVCNGLKYKKIDNAPCLSVNLCKACNGSGKKSISSEVTKDVIERADNVVLIIQRIINTKLYD